MSEKEKDVETIIDEIETEPETEDDVREVFEINKEDEPREALGAPLIKAAGDPEPADPNMIQKHLDNFLAKIAGETPVDDHVRNSTEYWLNRIAGNGGAGFAPVKIKKLWENPSPDSAFSSQSLPLDFDGADLIMLISRFSTSSTSGWQPPAIFPVINGIKVNTQAIGGANQAYRIATVGTNSLTFDVGKFIPYATMTVEDSTTNMIPMFIYGISFT